MPQIPKPLDDVTQMDLQALIEGGVAEGRQIDYKRDLPGNRDDDKKEFLADVSSFANAAGGDLIFGMVEEKGLPSAFHPIAGMNPDAEILRLEEIIRNGVEPRIPGVHLRSVPVEGGFALIIRVPQSWTLPHMVKFKNSSRFFSRTSAGKYQLDVSELRSLFARSADAAERVRRFRDERLARLVAGEGPFRMTGHALTVLHLVPMRLFDPGVAVDVRGLQSRYGDIRPLRSGGFGIRHNLDGVATFTEGEGSQAATYVQVFRSGAIEAADATMLHPTPAGEVIPGAILGRELVEGIPPYLKVLRDLGVEPPIVAFLTLIGVRDYRLASGPMWKHVGAPIDRDLVPIPEVIIDDWDVDVPSVLRPMLDSVWNAAGWPECALYGKSGEWQLPT